MAYRGWVKKLPSSLTAPHSALFSHHQTNNKNNEYSITSLQWQHLSCHQKPTSYTVATASFPILALLYKTGRCKKLWELVVIWLFYCDLTLTIFMNSMLSSTQNLLLDIIAQIDFWPATYTTPSDCSFQQGTSKNSDNWFGFAFFSGITLSSSQSTIKNGE